jgi:hypothetical protein
MPHGFTWGLVLLKDLSKTSKTGWHFHAQIEKWTIITITLKMMKIRGFKTKDFRGSNASWIYVVVNASLRSYIIHQDQSGFSHPNHKGKRGINNGCSYRDKAKMKEFRPRGCVPRVQYLACLHAC